MKNLLRDMSEELGPDFTSSYILGNVAQLLKSAFDDVEGAISTLVNDHLGLVYAPAMAVAVTPGGNTAQQSTNSAMAPAPIAPDTLVPVRYNDRIFKLPLLNPNLPALQGSHGRVNLHRLKAKLVETLKECGSLDHQLFLLHKVLTEGELAGIGLGLGLLQSPDVVERATKKTMSYIGELLRSTSVFGSHSNDSIAFQKTVFLLLAPTAPSDDAPAIEHRTFKDTIDTQAKFFELSKKQKKHLREMATLRRDMLNGVLHDFKLMQSYK